MSSAFGNLRVKDHPALCSLGHSHIYQIFTGLQICARQCSKYWGHSVKKDKDLCPYGKETQQTIKYLSKIYGISDGDNC